MSCAKTHEIRSHRSKRTYKPINKAMCHRRALQNKSVRKFIRNATQGKSIFDRLMMGLGGNTV